MAPAARSAEDGTPQRRFRYRQREGSRPGNREYNVQAQDQPRSRWQSLGLLMGSPGYWAGLRDGADAWTAWRPTRDAAVQDMANGRTFQTPMQERAREEGRQAAERMREAHEDEPRWRAEPPHASGAATDLEAS